MVDDDITTEILDILRDRYTTHGTKCMTVSLFYVPRASHVAIKAALRRLRQRGLVEYVDPIGWRITAAGMEGVKCDK